MVPFSDYFSTLILHSRLFKRIFFKAFPFFKKLSPSQRMFPKLYGSNSIFDVLRTSVYTRTVFCTTRQLFSIMSCCIDLCVLSVDFFAAENRSLSRFRKGAPRSRRSIRRSCCGFQPGGSREKPGCSPPLAAVTCSFSHRVQFPFRPTCFASVVAPLRRGSEPVRFC